MKTVTSAHLRRTGVPWQGERATSASALGSLNACALSKAVALVRGEIAGEDVPAQCVSEWRDSQLNWPVAQPRRSCPASNLALAERGPIHARMSAFILSPSQHHYEKRVPRRAWIE